MTEKKQQELEALKAKVEAMNEDDDDFEDDNATTVVEDESEDEGKKKKYAVDVLRYAKVQLANAKGVVKAYRVPVDENGHCEQRVDSDGNLMFKPNGVPMMVAYPINKENRICNDMIVDSFGIEFNKGTLVKGQNGTDEKMPSLIVIVQPDVVSLDWGARYDKGRKFEYKAPVPYVNEKGKAFLSECNPSMYTVEETVTDKDGNVVLGKDNKPKTIKKKYMALEEDGFTPKYELKPRCIAIPLPNFDGSFDSVFTDRVKAEIEKYRNSLKFLQWLHLKVVHKTDTNKYYLKFFSLDDKCIGRLPTIIER